MTFRNVFTVVLLFLSTLAFSQGVVRPTQIGRFDNVQTDKFTLKRGVFTGKALEISSTTAKSYLIPSALAVYEAINARMGNATWTLPVTTPDTTTGVRTAIIWTGSGAGTDTATFVNATVLTTREVVSVVTDTIDATLVVGNNAFEFPATQDSVVLTLPASPTSGDVVYVEFDDAVTNLIISGGSKTIVGTAATSASAGTVLSYLYLGGAFGKWIRRD